MDTDHPEYGIIIRFIRLNLTLLLQPNLFIDKDNFDLNPVVMLRSTRKERDKEKDKDKDKESRDKDRDRDRDKEKDKDNHDKPSSNLLSLDAFRLNWTGSNEDSIPVNTTGTLSSSLYVRVCVCALNVVQQITL